MWAAVRVDPANERTVTGAAAWSVVGEPMVGTSADGGDLARNAAVPSRPGRVCHCRFGRWLRRAPAAAVGLASEGCACDRVAAGEVLEGIPVATGRLAHATATERTLLA